MSFVRYMVEGALDRDTYVTETPEAAVAAYINERTQRGETVGKVQVFVLDYIGDFEQTKTVTRLRPTHPDSPNAKARAQPAS